MPIKEPHYKSHSFYLKKSFLPVHHHRLRLSCAACNTITSCQSYKLYSCYFCYMAHIIPKTMTCFYMFTCFFYCLCVTSLIFFWLIPHVLACVCVSEWSCWWWWGCSCCSLNVFSFSTLLRITSPCMKMDLCLYMCVLIIVIIIWLLLCLAHTGDLSSPLLLPPPSKCPSIIPTPVMIIGEQMGLVVGDKHFVHCCWWGWQKLLQQGCYTYLPLKCILGMLPPYTIYMYLFVN